MSVLTVPEFPERPAPYFEPADANALTVDSQVSYERACAVLREIRDVRRQIEADRKQLKEGVLAAGRAIDSKAKVADAPWLEAEAVLAPRITAYMAEQERARREEQRRLEEEQRRIAEEEQLRAAEAAQSAGASVAEVEAILDEVPQVQTIIAPPRVQRVAGISTPETWSAEVTDKAAFVRWVAANGQFDFVDVRLPALNAMARAQRNNLQIPGVRVVSSRGVRVGR